MRDDPITYEIYKKGRIYYVEARQRGVVMTIPYFTLAGAKKAVQRYCHSNEKKSIAKYNEKGEQIYEMDEK